MNEDPVERLEPIITQRILASLDSRKVHGAEAALEDLVRNHVRTTVERCGGGMRLLRAAELRSLADSVDKDACSKGVLTRLRSRTRVRRHVAPPRLPKTSPVVPPLAVDRAPLGVSAMVPNTRHGNAPLPPRGAMGSKKVRMQIGGAKKRSARRMRQKAAASRPATQHERHRGLRNGESTWSRGVSSAKLWKSELDGSQLDDIAGRVGSESPREEYLQRPLNRETVDYDTVVRVNGQGDDAGVLVKLEREKSSNLLTAPGMMSRLSGANIDPMVAKPQYALIEAMTEYNRDKEEEHLLTLHSQAKGNARSRLREQLKLKEGADAREAREDIAEALRMQQDISKLHKEEQERRIREHKAKLEYAKELDNLVRERHQTRVNSTIMSPGEISMNRDMLSCIAVDPDAALYVIRSRRISPEELCRQLAIKKLPEEVYERLSALEGGKPTKTQKFRPVGTSTWTRTTGTRGLDVLGNQTMVPAETGIDGLLTITATGPMAPPPPQPGLRDAALFDDPGLYKMKARLAREKRQAAYQRRRALEMTKGLRPDALRPSHTGPSAKAKHDAWERRASGWRL